MSSTLTIVPLYFDSVVSVDSTPRPLAHSTCTNFDLFKHKSRPPKFKDLNSVYTRAEYFRLCSVSQPENFAPPDSIQDRLHLAIFVASPTSTAPTDPRPTDWEFAGDLALHKTGASTIDLGPVMILPKLQVTSFQVWYTGVH